MRPLYPSNRVLQVAQPAYQLLVANFSKPHTSEIGTANTNPVRTRSGFVFQNTPGVVQGAVVGTGTGALVTPPPHTAQVGSVEVGDNDFAVAAKIFVGDYTLVSGEDFAVGGTVDATAANIASAIDNLPRFSASAAGAVVSVTGPLGSQPVRWATRVEGAVANFVGLTPDNGFLASGDPQRGGNVVLPV